jgi:Putative Actinobacterial Holin-X, holin superfamily III
MVRPAGATNMDDKAHQAALSDLIGDVGAKAAALMRAEMRVLTAEMAQKFSMGTASLAWLAAGAFLLMSAFAFALIAVLLLMISFGIEPHVSAAILAVILTCVGLAMVLAGRAHWRQANFLPDRTLARLGRDMTIFKRNARDA